MKSLVEQPTIDHFRSPKKRIFKFLTYLQLKLKRRTRQLELKKSDFLILLGTIAALVGATFIAYWFQPDFFELHQQRMKSTWGNFVFNGIMVLMVLKLSFLVYILYWYLKYKPIKSVSDDKLPVITVIVPAYNEGKQVLDTLKSIANSNYPKEKLEIISIDDGSEDYTWYWMQQAKIILGDTVKIYQQPENRGKRQALYRGFHLGKGEVFVTIDSDSEITEDTLRNLVSPFVVNEKCGAVAGNVRVLNNKNAVIPRMLNVSFLFSFEFIRSAQSMLGSVLCTPGALSAYRREAVMNCLEEWINQTFMGEPSDIGEDRAMTNMILKQGYHVLFQQNAFVYTNTPEKYKNLYKMFIRWERSNVRENISMGSYVFTNFREESKLGLRIIFFNQWLKVILAYPLVLLMFLFVFTHPILFVVSTLVSIFMFSSVQVLFCAKKQKSILESVWAYPYSVFYAFTLFWITPYAIATASKSGWLTR